MGQKTYPGGYAPGQIVEGPPNPFHPVNDFLEEVLGPKLYAMEQDFEGRQLIALTTPQVLADYQARAEMERKLRAVADQLEVLEPPPPFVRKPRRRWEDEPTVRFP